MVLYAVADFCLIPMATPTTSVGQYIAQCQRVLEQMKDEGIKYEWLRHQPRRPLPGRVQGDREMPRSCARTRSTANRHGRPHRYSNRQARSWPGMVARAWGEREEAGEREEDLSSGLGLRYE
ncbi:unnamed protein product [Jaminaea pallidilutea]